MNNLKLNWNELLELHALVKYELKNAQFQVNAGTIDYDEFETLESLNSKIENLFNDNRGHIYKTASIIDNKIELSDEIESIDLVEINEC